MGLFLLVGLPALAVPRIRRTSEPLSIWDIPRTAQIYTTVVGSFAGFAAASTVFVARLGFDRPTQDFEEVMGLLALSFMMLATSAMQFGNTPNAVGREDEKFVRVQRLSFLVSNTALTQGVIASWLALQTLTNYIGLIGLAEALGLFMIFVVALGLLRLTQYVHDCTALPIRWCVAGTTLVFVGALLYFYGFGGLAPHYLPPAGQPFHYAFVSAMVVGTGFGWQSVMFSVLLNGKMSDALTWRFEQLATAHTEFAAALLCLLAFSMLAR
ncbi:MAG: hypothetical protein U0360_01600 [Dehalococcoidia bacterium]